MSGFRWHTQASAGPAREAVIGGAKLLIRLRLFNEPYEPGISTEPDAFTDLRTGAARDLAFELLAAAEHAEHLTDQANGWEHER